jgi:hypothetical protein
MIPSRWTKLRWHPEQQRLRASSARWRVVAAGRRSGKTELAKRRLIEAALDPPMVSVPTFIAAAPTRDQAKRIWWDDLKGMSPLQWVSHISESELTIYYKTGARVLVVGLDRPQRIEGIAIDGAVIDEIDECRASVWTSSLRPALSTADRPGWCWFIGRPKGRRLLYDLFQNAANTPDWEAFHWTSAEVIGPSEVAAARRDLDLRSFQQEYEAAFLSATGLVYYAFDRAKHLRTVRYDPSLPLVVALDFNVSPGSAVLLQEQMLPPWDNPHGAVVQHTVVVGEVHIPDDSRTDLVCQRIAQRFAGHAQEVYLYGDPAGNQRRTSAQSNDWDIVRQHLRQVFSNVRDRVAKSAPLVVDSSNSVNARLCNAAGEVRFAMDAAVAPQLLMDLEGVAWIEDHATREIDKSDSKRTHWSDALRYYLHERFPIGGNNMRVN